MADQKSIGEFLGITTRQENLFKEGMYGAARQVRKGVDLNDTGEPMSFKDFVEMVNPKYKWSRHNIVLCKVLQEVADGKRNRVIINLPPRHGKTELVSRLFPAYWLYRWPDEWVGLATYGSELSEAVSSVAQSNYVTAGGTLSNRFTAAKHWETSDGGGMWAAGMRGPITGKEGNLLIIDDPIKNAEESMSEATGNGNKEWYMSTFYTRESWRHSAIIVMNTRWPGPGDIVGWLLEQEGTDDDEPERWHIVVMPALYEEHDQEFYEYPTTCTVEPDWRVEGEALWPERYNEKKLRKIKKRVQPFWWASLYQQWPHDRAGNKFKREWFTIIEPRDVPAQTVKDVRFWDLANTSKKRGDWTVGLKMRRVSYTEFIILDVVRIREEGDSRDQVIRRTAMRDGKRTIQWGQKDPAAAGKQAARAFRILLSGYDVRLESISGDKELRGDPAASAAEAGFFKIVKAPWNKAFLDEVVTLWTGTHDDQGDCLAGAYNKLALTGRLTRVKGDRNTGSTSSITLGM